MFCPMFMHKKLVMHPAKDTLKSVIVVPANQNPVNQNMVSKLLILKTNLLGTFEPSLLHNPSTVLFL